MPYKGTTGPEFTCLGYTYGDLKRGLMNDAVDQIIGQVMNVATTENGITFTVDPSKRSLKRQWFEVQRILRNGPATIVFWGDGTKTVVKRPGGKEDDIYEAFTAALGIKMYKTNSHLKKLIKTKTVEAK